VISTVWTNRRHHRVAMVAATTLAVSTLAAPGPSQVTVVAYAASPAVATNASAVKAGALAATGTASAGTSATQRAKAGSTTTKAPARVGTLAPYRFATKAYNQWWARKLMARHGWTTGAQFRALVKLWDRESHWNHKSHNRGSGAHGIPQALPGSKMRSAGADWRTNPVTQIKWGLNYIDSRYGSPAKAWAHFLRHGWY
jgi:hypothetical protein